MKGRMGSTESTSARLTFISPARAGRPGIGFLRVKKDNGPWLLYRPAATIAFIRRATRLPRSRRHVARVRRTNIPRSPGRPSSADPDRPPGVVEAALRRLSLEASFDHALDRHDFDALVAAAFPLAVERLLDGIDGIR